MGLLIAINVENGIDMLKNSSEVKMINQTLLKIRELREDISEYLFHFTKGEDAFETLQKILDEGKLRSFNEDRYICFTEAPITMLNGFFNFVERNYSTPTIIAPYGIGIKKDILFQKGARPVIYGTREEKKLLPEKLQWRHVNMNLPNYDFSWLREWRIKCNFIKFKPEHVVVITRTKGEQLLLHKVKIDNPGNYPEIDESMIEFQRIYKGVSLEELENDVKNKHDLALLLVNQEEEIEEG
jgi:hypothetical protein